MPYYRCRYYDDQGNAVQGGCRNLGTCGFIHPSDPGWDATPRKQIAGGQGGAGSAGPGLGRGGPSRPFAARTASRGLPTRPASNRQSSRWGDPQPTIATPTIATPDATQTWQGWDSTASADWGGSGNAGADLGAAKGKGKEKADIGGWGNVPQSTSEIGMAWGDDGEAGQVVDSGANELDPWGNPDPWGPASNAGGWGTDVNANAGGGGSGWGGDGADTASNVDETMETSTNIPSNPLAQSSETQGISQTDPLHFAMDVDEDPHRASSHARTDSDLGSTTRDFASHPPQTLSEKRQACIMYLKQVAKAVELQNRISKEEESLVRFKRMQGSEHFGRVGTLGRQILDTKRGGYSEKLHSLKKDFDTCLEKLMKLPGVETYVSGLRPDTEHQLIRKYLEEVKKWTTAIEPSIRQVVATERAAREAGPPASDSSFISSPLQPVLHQLQCLEERLQNVDAEFDHHAERILDSMLDEKLKRRHEEIVTAVARAQDKAYGEAMAQPLNELDAKLLQVGHKIEEQAGQVASLIIAKRSVDDADRNIKAEHLSLLQRTERLEADNVEMARSIQEALRRSRELREQIEALPDPNAAPQQAPPDEIMERIEPKLQETLRSDMIPVLQALREHCYHRIDEHQERLYKTVWEELHPTLMLVDHAHQRMDQLVAAAEGMNTRD
ncbi:hypothetical protein DENSPDRAFT_931536 [Dentipellis sp. KUC8613]|nr:hypothetical protein DENSPDRAFT_931536 [Dentipellis sp. KUC8613]